MFHIPAHKNRRTTVNACLQGGRRSTDDQAQLLNAERMLIRWGYKVSSHASVDGHQHLVVQDLVHHSRGGKLVLMGYEPVTLRGYDAARKFIDARS